MPLAAWGSPAAGTTVSTPIESTAGRPRLSGAQARDAARELVALSVEMQRPAEAVPALRELLRKDPQDSWAAEALLGLLAGEGPAREEALALRSLLAASTVGSVRAAHLVERARLLRALGRPAEARSDLVRATEDAREPGPLWKEVAELARAEKDVAAELHAWRAAVAASPLLRADAAPRLLALGHALLEGGEAREAQAAFAEAARAAVDARAVSLAHLGAAEAAHAAGDAAATSRALLSAAEQGPLEHTRPGPLAKGGIGRGLGRRRRRRGGQPGARAGPGAPPRRGRRQAAGAAGEE